MANFWSHCTRCLVTLYQTSVHTGHTVPDVWSHCSRNVFTQVTLYQMFGHTVVDMCSHRSHWSRHLFSGRFARCETQSIDYMIHIFTDLLFSIQHRDSSLSKTFYPGSIILLSIRFKFSHSLFACSVTRYLSEQNGVSERSELTPF